MGCDIHTFVEVRDSKAWAYVEPEFPLSDWEREWQTKRGILHPKRSTPFDMRTYSVFGVLADVRNYSRAPVIAEAKGLPNDISNEVQKAADDANGYAHSHSWFTVAELLAFEWDRVFWDRRVTKQTASGIFDGAALADEGEGEHITLREHVGEWFFKDLAVLKALGDPDNVRVVFWFDN